MNQSTKELSHNNEVQTYRRFPFVVEKGKGSWVFTDEGEKYLDLYGGHAVTGTGHCHPRVVAAIKGQAETMLFYSNLVYMKVRAEAASLLVKKLPDNIDKVFFVNSGTEANENAIKIARKITGRETILSFEGGFHGRTMASAGATGIKKVREAVTPLAPAHLIVPFCDLVAVEKYLSTGKVAGLIIEPIQSMAGVVSGKASFYQGLADLCNRFGTKLIYDEVQTGIGRCGGWFYAGRHGVTPDIVTMGKSMASGVPMAAVAVSDEISDQISFGDLGTTFGGGPLACAAMIATLEVIEDESLIEHAFKSGEFLKSELSSISGVESVQGEGFLLGIRFFKEAKSWQHALLEKYIITGLSNDPYVLRLMPPLNISSEELKLFIDAVRSIASIVCH